MDLDLRQRRLRNSGDVSHRTAVNERNRHGHAPFFNDNIDEVEPGNDRPAQFGPELEGDGATPWPVRKC